MNVREVILIYICPGERYNLAEESQSNVFMDVDKSVSILSGMIVGVKMRCIKFFCQQFE